MKSSCVEYGSAPRVTTLDNHSSSQDIPSAYTKHDMDALPELRCLQDQDLGIMSLTRRR